MASGNEYTTCLKFYMTITSAKNLPNVREFCKTRAYAKVSIGSNGKKIKRRTDSDDRNGLNPAWNHAMSYEIEETGVLNYGLSVVIELYTKRTVGDRYIGEVHTSMKDLFDIACAKGGNATLSLPVTQGSSITTDAILNFSYSFGQRYQTKKSDFMKKVKKFGVNLITEVAMQSITLGIFSVDDMINADW